MPKTAKTTKSSEAGAADADKAPRAARAAKAAAKGSSRKTAPKAKPKAATGRARGTKVAEIPPGGPEAAERAGTAGDEASDRFVEAQRLELLAERDAYTRSANSLRAEAEELAQDREPGDVQFDEESGEGDSMNVERERDLALSAQALASVEEIDRALAKIEAGTYGVCEKCGEPIPRERLKALPHASLCVRCKSGGLGRR